MLRPLYRSLPRSFVVWDGKVTETWSGLAPMVLATADTRPPARALTDRKASGEAR